MLYADELVLDSEGCEEKISEKGNTDLSMKVVGDEMTKTRK